LRWLEGTPRLLAGTSWGVPWPQGRYAKDTAFALTTAEGQAVPVQSWPLATWPDGSLKWTAHAVAAGAPAAEYELRPGAPAKPPRPLAARETGDAVEVDTGVIAARVARRGAILVPAVTRAGREILLNGRLVLLRSGSPDGATPEPFAGEIGQVTLEQSGPVRAVVKIEGRHRGGGREFIPFVVRLYFHAGSEQVRVMHTLVFDGDKDRDFLRGVGLRFDVPLRGELHDRHVRFAGLDDGIFGEGVRNLTGLRRQPGAAVTAAQVAGQATPPLASWNQAAATRLQYVPAYDDWTLFQANADGFSIRKRTREGFTWLTAGQGQRAGGLGYVGTPQGGVAFGIRNFWESHPAQLDIRGATRDAAEVTAWLWAPDAAPMDLRSYHDGLGQDTYAKQYNGGLEITYEDYEPGFDTPEGVARTSELHLWLLEATPARERLAEIGSVLRTPPQLATTPAYLQACAVFGALWSPTDRSTPARAAVEDQLAFTFDYYLDQREQRRWYGFWNYGDVMHTYDPERHEWRYDVGGFAWDNSELSTDLWLWLYYLSTGRADVFRFAEAMTRHTGEVDVHHLGRFAPLGSRHNVLHWGCSAKQLRIATALNRRYYYYLTGDERVGDLMREQIEAGRALVRIPPGRKLSSAENPGDLDRPRPKDPNVIGLSVGTDWGSLAGAWLTEWERTGDPKMRDRLLAGMRTLGGQPKGFFSTGLTMNLESGAFDIVQHDNAGISHLNAVFGLVEVCAELIQLLDVPEFRKVWLDYCELYNAPAEVQTARVGRAFNGSLVQGHSRLTAYAAKLKGDPELAKRAWSEFFRQGAGSRSGGGQGGRRRVREVRKVAGPAVLRPVDEVPMISTNDAAQSGLAAIQCLALVPEAIPDGT
ncbi:MAG TPA: Tat pathway signal sequence domain protein, partial [Opitutaceae bacterium]|nr:Tat pathway signal sequence domain protein [Opitutaceae bacterium]